MKHGLKNLPSLNALRAFEVAARHLSFQAAATEMGVTQSAVAQHVRGLEAELDIRLFDRLPRSLALTEAGRDYISHIRRAFELITDATASLRPVPMHVTISVTPTFASKWLIPLLTDFTAMHPLLDLRILASEALANFHSDGVDMAVRQGNPPFSTGLTADLLFPQEIVAVCSPMLVAGRSPRPIVQGLSKVTLLHDAHDLWPEFMDKALGQLAFSASKNIRFNQTSLAIDAAMAGQGLALANRFLVEQDLRAGRLVLAFPHTLRGQMDFYIVSPRKSRASGPTAAVRDWLLQQRSRPSTTSG